MSDETGSIQRDIGELTGIVKGLAELIKNNQNANERNFTKIWDLHNDKIAPAVNQIANLQKQIDDNKKTAADAVEKVEKKQSSHEEGHTRFRVLMSTPFIALFAKWLYDFWQKNPNQGGS